MPVLKYFQADITVLDLTIPHIGFLAVKDPKSLLEPQHNTQLPGVVGCNLIQLGCKEFGKVHGFEVFETFHCLDNVQPLVFAQMCSFYHQGKLSSQSQSSNQINSQSTTNVNTSGITSKAKRKDLSPGLEKSFRSSVGRQYSDGYLYSSKFHEST